MLINILPLLFIFGQSIAYDIDYSKYGVSKNKFPKGFIFGASTSAFQTEGSWDADGKSPSGWDIYSKSEKILSANQNATLEVAADSYRLYKRDIEMLVELGVNSYRFSIPWSRILPKGFPYYINQVAVDHYNDMINLLIENNIEPVVTMLHFDLPQVIVELGGFTSADIVDWFGDYARILYTLYGDRVKYWVTINEPLGQCFGGYSSGLFSQPPGTDVSGFPEYVCAKYVLKAHAKAYRIYDDEFRHIQGGKIGLSSLSYWADPLSDSVEDIEAARSIIELMINLFNDPVYHPDGGFPEYAVSKITNRSLEYGLTRSRLEQLSDEDREFIKGTYDYFGTCMYHARYAYYNDSVAVTLYPHLLNDVGLGTYRKDQYIFDTDAYGTPDIVRSIVEYVSKRYNNPEILITENGIATDVQSLNDDNRVIYLRAYLDEVLKLIHDDGYTNIIGYHYWSLLDNYELARGYTTFFGLYQVDFENVNRTRTPRKSALVYKDIIARNYIDWNYEPEV